MRRETQATAHIAADPATVFAIVSDHEATDQWVPKVEVVKLLESGTPKNGVPALRRVTFKPFGWGTIEERITAFDAEAGTFSYTITAGMVGVRDHLGTFTVRPAEGGCTVTWAVWFEFNPWIWALGAGIFVNTFTQAMEEGLATLANQQLNGA